MKNLTNEAGDLLTYLEKEGLSEREACAVMGIAITALIKDPKEAEEFIRILTAQFKDDGGRPMESWLN